MTQLFLVLRLNGWIITQLLACCFSYPDIVVYLLHTTSFATLDDVKITFLILLPLHIEQPCTSKILVTLQTFEYCSHTWECEIQLCSQQGSPPSIGTGLAWAG